MITSYEVYKIGSKVYGISKWYHEGKETDHLAVYDARVKGVCLEYEEETNQVVASYQLTTPSGNEWGDFVPQDQVSDSFEDLIEKVKLEWMQNSNRF